ncbi:MAG TPA: DUF72 domain-containing protein [Pseudomonadales bacterium]
MARVRIGTSGWSYRHWRGGAFYPKGLPQRCELGYLAEHLDSVEINGSFYSLLRPETYSRYREQVPDGFVFAVKGGRFITHSKKLKDVDVALANFFASGVLCLEATLGPLLWQLPQMRIDPDRVARFLDLLPRDTAAAAKLARRHDHRVRGRSQTSIERSRPLRHALEVRDPSHLTETVVRLCRQRRVPLVFSHSGDWPYHEELTAGWCYLRLHGAPHTYASDYSARALGWWARRVRRWADGGEPEDARRLTKLRPPARRHRDVYVYFDNDGSAHAPHNARALRERLGR